MELYKFSLFGPTFEGPFTRRHYYELTVSSLFLNFMEPVFCFELFAGLSFKLAIKSRAITGSCSSPFGRSHILRNVHQVFVPANSE